MECGALKRVAWLILASSLCGLSQALWISLPPTGSKCVSEEIHSNVVVLADYYVITDDYDNTFEANISAKVTSPFGGVLYNVQNVKSGQFAFTTHEAGTYLACFWAEINKNQTGNLSINLDWKTGIAAKDWASVAKKEKIEGVELELKKLEGAVETIHENLLFLKTRELEIRLVSETANTRVALCSLLSLAVCLAVSASQLIYLKQYFRKKKLI